MLTLAAFLVDERRSDAFVAVATVRNALLVGMAVAGAVAVVRGAAALGARRRPPGRVDRMTIRVGINGFGRIGRNFFRAAKQRGADIDFVAANDLLSTELTAHLLKYDTILGTWDRDVRATANGIAVDDDELQILAERDPKALPWSDLGVDMVIEATGIFSDRDKAAMHLDAGAPFVIVSAPSKGADATFVVGVNDDTFDPATHKVVSNASCTTNCFVPMVKVLDDAFGVEQGPHDDGPRLHRHPGARRRPVEGPARGAGRRGQPHPELDRRRQGHEPRARGDGRAPRRAVPAGAGARRLDHRLHRHPRSATSPSTRSTSAFRAAASSGPLSKVLVYSEAPIVSSDIVGSPASCTFDSPLTMAMGNLVKIMGWYDNEWGYSNRLVDLIEITGAKLAAAK